jgi:RimJ/RimL family protein N-acetyltransferase
MTIAAETLDLIVRTPKEVREWIASLDEETRREISPDWIAQSEAATAPDPWIHGFVMVSRVTGEPVGSCAFKGPPDDEGAVEIGYGVDDEHRGKGFATESARAMAHFALGDDSVRIVRAHTRHDGAASMRVLEKCGFARVGDVIDPEDGPVVRWELRKTADA